VAASLKVFLNLKYGGPQFLKATRLITLFLFFVYHLAFNEALKPVLKAPFDSPLYRCYTFVISSYPTFKMASEYPSYLAFN